MKVLQSGGKYIRVVAFLFLCYLVTAFLNQGLIPENYAEEDVGRITASSYDDIFLGASHGANDINPDIVDSVTGRKSTNVCLPREFPVDSYHLLELAISSGHKPRRVIYELDPSYWMLQEPEDGNSYYIYRSFPDGLTKLHYFKNKIMKLDWRFTLAPWCSYTYRFRDFGQNFSAKMTMSRKEYRIKFLNSKDTTLTDSGMMEKHIIPGTRKDGVDKVVPFLAQNLKQASYSWFLKTAFLCRDEGIEFIVIRTPVPENTRKALAESYRASTEFYGKLCADNGIPYHDFSADGDERLKKPDEYADADGHMDYGLACYFSRQLGQYLKK